MDVRLKTMATEEEQERSKTIAGSLMPHVVSLILLPSREAGPSDVVSGGSGALIDTGEKKLLITCEHVWSAFQKYISTRPDAVAAMSTGNEIPVINNLPEIVSDKGLDITVLDLGDGHLLNSTSKTFCRTEPWPPTRPGVGQLLVALGFPGSLRKPTEDGENLQFTTVDIEDEIISVSDRHIALADEDRVREKISHLGDDGPEDLSLGGISGCPAFVYRNSRFEFAGIVYEADEGGNGILYASHADFITASGLIDWPRVPPV